MTMTFMWFIFVMSGSSLHPLLAMPPHMPAQLPQTRKGPVASPWPSHPSVPLPHLSVPPPSIQDSVPVVPPTPPPGNPQRIERPFMPQAPGRLFNLWLRLCVLITHTRARRDQIDLVYEYAASMASPSMNPPPNRQTTRPLVPGSMPPTSPEAKSPESDTTLSPIPPGSRQLRICSNF